MGKNGVIIASLLAISIVRADAQTTMVQTDVPSLKDVFSNDFSIGCILSYKHVGFPEDPAVPGQSAVIAPNGGDLIKYHMNCMSPGNNMKSMYTVDIAASASAYNSAPSAAQRDSIETHPIVRFNGDLIAQLNWAKRNGFTFRGHTLVWHNQTPTEFFRSGYRAAGARVSKATMIKRMDSYIGEVIRLIHEGWPGLLSAIDVVNEAIGDGTGRIRVWGNEWYAVFGDDSYVLKAFELARKYTALHGETQIKLYYNDYNTSDQTKADGIVRLCGPIFARGYLDGIGMQEHDAIYYPAAENWIRSYDKFYPICSEMSVTELDVPTNNGTNFPSPSVLAAQANQYAALFKCFIERSFKSGRGKIINVTKDGLNDQYAFVENQSSSLWDANCQCKPSFFAVVDVGRYYNELAALVSRAGKLDRNEFSAWTWTSITSALKSAKEALARNYSAYVSAPENLRRATDVLKDALEKK
jgi:endo-1,4-beta-xylanase